MSGDFLALVSAHERAALREAEHPGSERHRIATDLTRQAVLDAAAALRERAEAAERAHKVERERADAALAHQRELLDALDAANARTTAAEARASLLERERDEVRGALRRCVDHLVERDWGRRFDGNAPGHGHSVPGVWDSDNGAKAGTRCEWCAAWPSVAARALPPTRGGGNEGRGTT
jgi:hypothetical protein